jgi:hypothetical protein
MTDRRITEEECQTVAQILIKLDSTLPVLEREESGGEFSQVLTYCRAAKAECERLLAQCDEAELTANP